MKTDLDLLRHMLGVGSHIPKNSWGYRNYFASAREGKDYEGLKRLEAHNLVRCYDVNPDIFKETIGFSATLAGCHAIGLKPAQIKRAFQP